jgi:hypothetical protein
MCEDMGCGSSKRTAVMPVAEAVGEEESAVGLTRRASEAPTLEGDLPAEHLREESVRRSVNSGSREPIGLYRDCLRDDSSIYSHY